MSLLQGLFSGEVEPLEGSASALPGLTAPAIEQFALEKHVHFPSSMPKFKADKEKEVRATGANWGTQT